MNFLGQGQGQPINQGISGQGIGQGIQGIGQGIGQGIQGIGQGIGDKISSLGSGLSSVTQQGTASNISFYTIVVGIAVVILILVLAFLGWTMSKQKDTDNFPKLQTTCPDYWGVTEDGKCTQPAPGQVNYGNEKASNDAPGFSENKFDFANAGWSAGGNAVCQKKKWANSHGINWDTVTNVNYC
jgi:hypothetical protein